MCYRRMRLLYLKVTRKIAREPSSAPSLWGVLATCACSRQRVLQVRLAVVARTTMLGLLVNTEVANHVYIWRTIANCTFHLLHDNNIMSTLHYETVFGAAWYSTLRWLEKYSQRIQICLHLPVI